MKNYKKCHSDCIYHKIKFCDTISNDEWTFCDLYSFFHNICNNYISKKHIEILKEIALKHKADYDATWLPTNPNLALLICLGAGPWRIERRTKIQKKVIKWYLSLNVDDLSKIVPNQVKNLYPLNWQNNHLFNIIEYLRIHSKTFWEFYFAWKNIYDLNQWEDIPKELFKMAKVPKKGTKTLWLFIRDCLQKPAFPIDRHVTRKLKEYELPQDSYYVTNACIKAGIDSNELNRAFFSGKNNKF